MQQGASTPRSRAKELAGVGREGGRERGREVGGGGGGDLPPPLSPSLSPSLPPSRVGSVTWVACSFLKMLPWQMYFWQPLPGLWRGAPRDLTSEYKKAKHLIAGLFARRVRDVETWSVC